MARLQHKSTSVKNANSKNVKSDIVVTHHPLHGDGSLRFCLEYVLAKLVNQVYTHNGTGKLNGISRRWHESAHLLT